jgi:hypothetical protein
MFDVKVCVCRANYDNYIDGEGKSSTIQVKKKRGRKPINRGNTETIKQENEINHNDVKLLPSTVVEVGSTSIVVRTDYSYHEDKSGDDSDDSEYGARSRKRKSRKSASTK